MNPDPNPQPDTDHDESKIHAEEVKDRHTTHWDRDYLSTEELDAAYREGREKTNKNEGEDSTDSDD
ncbi:hypothetical protein NZK35_04645 [Stieleria sp. ICT_E10.1]|uniref:hypothetical protein n=1 Tax=Stieleria sedimenti TaxID=2976331 RepID=UPI00217F8367|nr:hypothetical protein [Stieleria sedimenti]MCS7465960.1 hypothetical protein [Stieleria sedimenti]